ncbi:3-phosphoshikimate 1-carboxyvinyltransferase [Chloroflexota bacterium]
MKVSLNKSEVKGKMKAPPSKSYTIRGLMCAALAQGESEIINPLISDDTAAAVDVLSKVGVRISQEKDLWRVIGGDFHAPDTDLFCGESATTWRFMTAICSIVPGTCCLVASPSLSKRPIKPLIEALGKLGVDCSRDDATEPIIVEGGRLKGGSTSLPGHISSQFISALLTVAPLAEKEVRLRLTSALESKPYLMITLRCLKRFGIRISKSLDNFVVARQTYQPARWEVEGDWSSTSYFLALGALSEEVEIENLNSASVQGDRILISFLRDMGTPIEVTSNSIIVRKSKMKAIKADLSDCIDLLPTMAVLAAVADGVSEFTGIRRARIKESDRVEAVKEGLERMGIEVKEEENSLTITGSTPEGAVIDSKNDHRIAMAFGILGSTIGGTVINEAECVSKTFPEFWDILKSIGGELKIDGK